MTLSPGRIAVVAGLLVVLAVAGFTIGRAVREDAARGGNQAATPAAASEQPGGAVPSRATVAAHPRRAPSSVAPGTTARPLATARPTPVALGPPVGWKLSDVPRFGPAPPPHPITLPTGAEVPFLSRVPTTQRVAFVTIDDGYLTNPEAPKLFAAAGVPVTLFLTTDAIRNNVAFFDGLRKHGAVIEAHTISHPSLRGQSAGFQHHQICGSADRLGGWFKRRPVLFRPPFGYYDHTTLRVAKECGMRAAFMWKETVHKGKVRYQQGHTVQRGDIILMHFRPAFIKDFLAALRAIKQAGLTPALLEDYVPGGPGRG